LRHRIAGVEGQVHDHLRELPGVGADMAELLRIDGHELDVLADEPAQQRVHVREHCAQVQHA